MPHLPRQVPRRHPQLSAPKRAQVGHQIQPSAASVMPATQNGGRCHQVPHVPREAKVDVAKCHAKAVREKWKMVCDKDGCERWCGVRWCVTKLRVKDGVVKDGV